ncbi:hypothetical protein LX32DRAFT_238632 [Colletotrichum zoysiae]|uniref:Secreted protein n=1 Tax=Colletotrichum zoysiae TaxID=1216348 RepID=A0AAD9LXA6_9PEZI|nr:hypothetical protein LX32DRAFT_238632 [Colletotrichum zoysiae]
MLRAVHHVVVVALALPFCSCAVLPPACEIVFFFFFFFQTAALTLVARGVQVKMSNKLNKSKVERTVKRSAKANFP